MMLKPVKSDMSGSLNAAFWITAVEWTLQQRTGTDTAEEQQAAAGLWASLSR